MDVNHSAALAHSLVDVRLGNRDLLLVLLLVLAKLGAPWDLEIRFKNLRMLQFRSQSLLEVGFDQHPDLEPLPGLSQQIGTQGPLARVQRQFLSSAKMSLSGVMTSDANLILQFLELHPRGLASRSSLKPGEDGADLVLTLLLHPATNAGPEEDLGVPEPVLVLVQLDDVHHSLAGGLVVLRLGNSRSSDDVVPCLK